jgi:hypothetical protein
MIDRTQTIARAEAYAAECRAALHELLDSVEAEQRELTRAEIDLFDELERDAIAAKREAQQQRELIEIDRQHAESVRQYAPPLNRCYEDCR